MDNQLAIYDNFENVSRAAIALHKSGYFKDVTSQEQAIVKIMAGSELGLPPFASMSGIHIIKGKPTLGSNIIATLVKNDPRYDYKVITCTDQECTIDWYENGEKAGTSQFTIVEASKITATENNVNIKLNEKAIWKFYPSDMLFARAISRGARRYAPGIFGGAPVYTPDEMGVDTDEEGYIDSRFTVINSAQKPTLTEAIQEESGGQSEPQLATTGKPKMSMSIETAMAITNSDGVLYGEIETAKLANMANAIRKVLSKPGQPQEVIDERQMKLDAIGIILKSRSQKE